jgi:quinol monooxygenase YgiN
MSTTKIVVSGEIRLDPADFDAALALIEPLVTATRAEAGCVEYDYWVDPRDRGRVRVFEEWESDDAIAAHSASEHMKTFFGEMAKLRISSVELSRFEVSDKSPLRL